MNNRHASQDADSRVRSTLEAWAPVLAIIALSLAAALGGDAAREWGRYERDALEAGEWWRLLTAHVVHLSWPHTALNLVALVLIRVLLEDALAPREWALAALVSALAIDAGLYFAETDIDWYVGLSGVLHGLLAAGALRLTRAVPAVGTILLAGLAAKLVWEQLVGPLPFSESTTGGPVVVAAHLYGAAGGTLFALRRFAVRRGPRTPL